jgi:3-oxoacyl-[acyl-carrier protein] reductase
MNMRLRGLDDKVVIVTGAAAGIGRVTARRFAEEGCRVAAWDLDATAQGQICLELREQENRGLFRKMNIADAADVETAVSDVVARWGRIDVLVNNAGIVRDDQLVKWKDGNVEQVMGDEAFDAVISVNLKGTFHCAGCRSAHDPLRSWYHLERFFDRRTVRKFRADELRGGKGGGDRVYSDVVARAG